MAQKYLLSVQLLMLCCCYFGSPSDNYEDQQRPSVSASLCRHEQPIQRTMYEEALFNNLLLLFLLSLVYLFYYFYL